MGEIRLDETIHVRLVLRRCGVLKCRFRRTIPEEEQVEIYSEVQSQLHKSDAGQKVKRKRTFVKPTKLA